ncbi:MULTISPECIES: hypothetical protein [Bacillati]|uniref:Zinc transporter, ZIP family n=2 Tax=Bacillati TaxID=1783272 RepID=A0A3S2UV19_9BACI|nr:MULTISPECIES: hypothetical protein [Niallia]MDK8642974.1 hypothetical protein [Niallia taxi]MED4038274.1 hypothetical protein [Niallia taxi]MED4056624.1 hypothetical protein [Niallia taxi]MED4120643.1 hypothetical protein [Niallia taxi]RVT59430.1 hypothetical protein EM808_19210 [Niallia taxi]
MSVEIKVSLIIMSLVFMGIVLGGGLIRILFPFLRDKYYFLPLLGGGVLAGMLGFELIPEAIARYDILGLMAGSSVGIFFIVLVEKYTHNIKYNGIQNMKVIFLLFFALFIHSIPTGIALGINIGETDTSLLKVTLAHNIPEGMVLMTSLLISKAGINIFWILCAMLSAALAINVYVGMELNIASPKITTMFMGAGISTLGYVTVYEILWKTISR